MIQRIGGGLLSSHLRVMAALTCVGALGFSSARAESEFEYGRALIERSAPDFSTQDLVERLIAKLEASAATRADATLLKAILKRRLAQSASIATRAALLADAEKLYAEVLAGPKTYANYTFAERDEATLDFDCVKALKKGATEDPAQAAKLLGEAAAVMAKVAQKYRAQSDALYPEFQRCYNIYVAEQGRQDLDNPKPIPASILEPLYKAFVAWVDPDQRFIAASVEQLDCLSDKDPAKKTLAAEIVRVCEARNADEKLGEQIMATAWYSFMQGRVHAIMLDESKADEILSINIDPQTLTPDQRRQFATIQKLVLRERIKLAMALQHYARVIQIVTDIDESANFFNDDSGKEILSAYTRALTKAEDADSSQFERAVRTLQAMIVREDSAGSAWSAEFAGAIAETVAGARGKHLPLKLRAAEWSSAARGFMIKAEDAYRRFEELQRGHAASVSIWVHYDLRTVRAQFDAAAAEYESAAECLRSAISAARKETAAARMKIESKAWLSLSRCYLRTHNYLEAVVACQSMLGTFGEKNRSWLPDPAKAVNRDVRDALPELDALVIQGADMLAYAKRLAIRFNPNNAVDLEPGYAGDSDYSKAKTKMELAASLEKMASPAAEIAAAYTAAADFFVQVKPASPNYEVALFQSALAWTNVQDQYAAGTMPGRPEDMQAKAREFAAKALGAFQKYEDSVAHTAAASESVTQTRESRKGTLLLMRSSLCLAAGEWIRASDTVDEFMIWLRQNPASKNGADGALRNKFRALMELSAVKDAPDADSYAKDAADCMNAWKSAAPRNDAVYQYMLARLSRRYDALASDATKRALAVDVVKACNEKVAEFEELRVASLKAGAATLSDCSYLFWTLHRAGRDERAIEVGKALLETFDPKGDGANIPDDEKPWQAMLVKMIGDPASGKRGIVRYDDLAKWDRCKQDHTLLVDFMYDTVSGAQYPNGDAHRPAFDRFNVDNERALEQIQTIRRNYPDCTTLKPELGENGKSYLSIIEAEIDFRRKIASARALLLDLVIGKGDELIKGKHEDDAKPYLELASNLLQVEIAKGNDSLDLRLKKAKLDATLGKYDVALKALYDIRAEVPSDSIVYFDASKLMSIVLARKEKWKDAAEFPEFIANIIGFDSQRVRERWPDMKEFLEECKKHEQK